MGHQTGDLLRLHIADILIVVALLVDACLVNVQPGIFAFFLQKLADYSIAAADV